MKIFMFCGIFYVFKRVTKNEITDNLFSKQQPVLFYNKFIYNFTITM